MCHQLNTVISIVTSYQSRWYRFSNSINNNCWWRICNNEFRAKQSVEFAYFNHCYLSEVCITTIKKKYTIKRIVLASTNLSRNHCKYDMTNQYGFNINSRYLTRDHWNIQNVIKHFSKTHRCTVSFLIFVYKKKSSSTRHVIYIQWENPDTNKSLNYYCMTNNARISVRRLINPLTPLAIKF